MLTGQTNLYSDSAEVTNWLSAEGVLGRTDDNFDGSADSANFMTDALNYATARCKMYLLGLYKDTDLATSWQVRYWCTALACCWLCRRRGNPVPASIEEACGQAQKELEAVKAGLLMVPELPINEAHWPAWSNVRVDQVYRTKKVRVQRPISEPTATKYPQTVDLPSEFTPEM